MTRRDTVGRGGLSSWLAAAVVAAGATGSAASADPVVRPVSTVGPIAKEHNVPGADNLLYLRLRIPATIHGERGNPVAMGVWFADERGQLIRSIMDGYGDANGALKVESATFRVAYDPAQREFLLALPYNAFPPPAKGVSRYSVEARAKLVRRGDPQGVIASATTRFWVER